MTHHTLRTRARVIIAVLALGLLAAACDWGPPTQDDPAEAPAPPSEEATTGAETPDDQDDDGEETASEATPNEEAPATEEPPAEEEPADEEVSEEDDGSDAALRRDYPGQPPSGQIYWGMNHRQDYHLAFHEKEAGRPFSLHRSFFQWKHRTSGYMMRVVNDDVENGRLPWISFKTPSWKDMAAGKHDAEIDEMLKQLDKVKAPIWLTIHHEPEGGGGNNRPDDPAGPSAHVAMNRRVRERMTKLGTDNIALVPILMTYTWEKASGRNPEDWYAPGIYDFLGVDHYRKAEKTLVNQAWADVRKWAEKKGLDVAVGEWAVEGKDKKAGDHVREWYEAAIASEKDGKGARVVGLAAFESDPEVENPTWMVEGGQLEAFNELLNDPRTYFFTEG